MKQILIKSGKVYFHRREWFLVLGEKGWLSPKNVEFSLGSELDKGWLVFVKMLVI